MPRITRDVSAIDVRIDPHGAQPEGRKVIGRGTTEEGGGLLRGGLVVPGQSDGDTPDVPH
ncbi:MAG: hypothetical protein ACRDP5_24170 [Streptosporangiaceae bacterium]